MPDPKAYPGYSTRDLKPEYFLEFIRRPLADAVRFDEVHLKSIGPRDSKKKPYGTVHFPFFEAIQRAVETVRRYLDDPSAKRPLNCLVLGPPGSGKTFLAQTIGKATGKSDILYLEYNLSRCDGTEQITAIFDEIVRVNQRFKQPKIILFDEFDVRSGGTSIIRYLIQPMYDGHLGEGRELGKTVFLFSGGTLKDRSTLEALQRNAADFDLIKFLYKLYGAGRFNDSENKVIRDFLDVTIKYRDARDKMTPGHDTFEFLRRLDKLPDFLSRINGFVIELPNLADPMNVTGDPLILAHEETPGTVPEGVWPRDRDIQVQRTLLREIVEMVEAAERVENAKIDIDKAQNDQELKGADPDRKLKLEYLARFVEDERTREYYVKHVPFTYIFDAPSSPLLVYKSMLMVERYFRVLFNLERRFEPFRSRTDDGLRPVFIKSSLLNYLCAVPLRHGMRSLEYLIRELDLVEEKYTQSLTGKASRIVLGADRLANPLFEMHALNSGLFSDPESLWRQVRRKNSAAFSKVDQTIQAEIAVAPGKGMVNPPLAAAVLKGDWLDHVRHFFDNRANNGDPDVLIRLWETKPTISSPS